ncbi:hypothetical protein [Paraburkholderia sp. SIMBA_054]|uniref:hypothetical protein n=1 Tax=Paraburkholderia sp. SIMBA_054 TaxID=3085795 RepID=UPI00397C7289
MSALSTVTTSPSLIVLLVLAFAMLVGPTVIYVMYVRRTQAVGGSASISPRFIVGLVAVAAVLIAGQTSRIAAGGSEFILLSEVTDGELFASAYSRYCDAKEFGAPAETIRDREEVLKRRLVGKKINLVDKTALKVTPYTGTNPPPCADEHVFADVDPDVAAIQRMATMNATAVYASAFEWIFCAVALMCMLGDRLPARRKPSKPVEAQKC